MRGAQLEACNLFYFVLLSYQQIGAVFLTQQRLFDLTGGISGHPGKNYLAGTLITRQIQTEIIDHFFSKRTIRFYLNDRSGDFAQPGIRQTDDRTSLMELCRRKKSSICTG